MKSLTRKLIPLAVLVAVAFGSLAVYAPASASEQGRRNTATALSAAALYELLRGHTTTGLILGGGSYYAWQRVGESDRDRNRNRSRRYSNRRYRSSDYAYRYRDYRYGGQYSRR